MAEEVTKEQAISSISSGSLNPRMLATFFDDMKIHSFTYDYVIQHDLGDVKFTKLKVSDGYSHMLKGAFSSTFNRVIEFTIPVVFTVQGEREKYKRSNIFQKYIDFNTMESNHRYFRYSVLISIDGTIQLDYRIKCMNERINFCFLQKDFDMDAKDITVYFLPDSMMTYMENPIQGLFNGNSISAENFAPKHKFKTVKPYIGYWIDKESEKSFMIPSITYDEDRNTFTINSALPTNMTKYHLLIIGIMNLGEIADFHPGVEWISFESKSMPLPKDNILILIQKDDTYQSNDGSVYLTEYYPNIYRITNPKKYPLRLLELYEDSAHNDHIVYDNEVARYMSEFNLLDKYRDGTVPKLLKEFKPVEWLYGIEDYLAKHPYKSLDLTNKWESFLYKINTISDMLKKWCYLYQEYVRRTYGFLGGWYHQISHYTNMDEKIRYNTSQEVDNDPDYTFIFGEPQYVFSYVHSVMTGDANSFCFFVDGRFTIPTKILVYKGYQYVYFPVSLIHEDTVIEVERFDGNIFSKKLDVPAEGLTVPLKGIMKYTTVANNLFLVDDATGDFLNKDDYQVIVVDPDLGEIEVDLATSVFIISNNCSLKITPMDGLARRIILACNDITYQYKTRESGLDFYLDREDEVTLNPNKYISKIKQDIGNRLRIYTEGGRLITKRSYKIYKYDNYYGTPRFCIPLSKETDRLFWVSYVGYDERLIYHKDNIPNNGLIKLDAKLSRPFSLTYHDVYLDGFRLTKYDIDIISPFTFAIKTEALKKYDTLSNVEIYEKCYIPDDFVRFPYGEKSEYILDRLFDQDQEFYNKVVDSLEKITPTGETEDVDRICDWMYEFFHAYLPYHFINADYRMDLEQFHHLFSVGTGRLLLNADDRIPHLDEGIKELYFNHDKSIELYDDKIPAWDVELHKWVIVPDDTVLIPEDEYRQHGYYADPMYNHVYDIEFKFIPEDLQPTEDAEDSVKRDAGLPAHESGELSSKDVDVPRYVLNPEYDGNSDR